MKGVNGWNSDSEYLVVRELPDSLGEVVALDVETSATKPYSVISTAPISIQLCSEPGIGYLISGEYMAPALTSLVASGRTIVAHGGKYEMNTCKNLGVDVPIHHDTMLMGFLLHPGGRVSLKDMARDELNLDHPDWAPELYKDKTQFVSYSVGDAELTIRLYNHLRERMAEFKNQYKIEMAVLPVLAAMEQAGVEIDVESLKRMDAICQTASCKIQIKLDEWNGGAFQVNSVAQVKKLLFETLDLIPTSKTPKGAPATNEKALKALENEHPAVKAILLCRRLIKLSGTYLDSLPKCVDTDGRIHTQFLQGNTPTKRLASTKPNMMNQPKRHQTKLEEQFDVRKAIRAAEGYYFIRADYSQIEFRVMIYSCGSPSLRKRMLDGEDFHTTTARILVNKTSGKVEKADRENAKIFNYGLAYGMDARGVSFRLGLSQMEANLIVSRFRQNYTGLLEWIQSEQSRAAKVGFSRTFLGKLRDLPELKSKVGKDKGKALRNAINDQIQGGAAEIFKMGLIRLHRALLPGMRMLLPVHDEVLMEVSNDISPGDAGAIVKEALEVDLGKMGKYPVELSWGPNWGDLTKIEL